MQVSQVPSYLQSAQSVTLQSQTQKEVDPEAKIYYNKVFKFPNSNFIPKEDPVAQVVQLFW